MYLKYCLPRSTLVKKDVGIRKFIAINHVVANALSDPARVCIMELLFHKPMHAAELAEALASSGFNKATTTIRHHLEILKSAGLIEVSRIEEIRGAVMKYYSPTAKVIPVESVNFDVQTKNLRLIDPTSTKVLKLIKSILEDRAFSMVADPKKCSLCDQNHAKEYLVFEILSSAIAKAIQSPEYLGYIKSSSGEKKDKKDSK